jgi:hypothetical protein
MNEIPGTSPVMTRVLLGMLFAAGFCFVVGGLCDLASPKPSQRRHEPW